MKRNRYLKRLIIGTVYLVILFLFFNTRRIFMPTHVAFNGAIISTINLLLVFIVNERFLFPRFFIDHQRKFVLLSILMIFLSAFLQFIYDHFILDLYTKVERPIPMIFPIMGSISQATMVVFIGTTVLLSERFRLQAVREKELKEEKLNTEIALLKAQINPHFIFNALNNIFSLSYSKSDNAPESILKLSQMLRYVFYECRNDKVSLSNELDYIENFIAFQQMKSPDKQNITFTHTNLNINLHIAPMLFIPFIENGFKYSKIEELKDAFVKINLYTENKDLCFTIKNSIPTEGKRSPGSGMGISNVRKRLDIIYSDKYSLSINDSNTVYSVELKIDLS